MTKDSRPRWQHRCPGCKRTIYWERVYCKACIEEYPLRGGFRLFRRNTSFRKRFTVIGVEPTSNHIYIFASGNMMCIECGRMLKDAKHRCYSRIDEVLITKRDIFCSMCKSNKPKHLFPLVYKRGSHIRTKVCADCLHGARLVIKGAA